jgi:hypothetical protein
MAAPAPIVAREEGSIETSGCSGVVILDLVLDQRASSCD